MSRNSQAKQARRKKRQAARAANWIPSAAESDPVAEALAGVDEWLAERGWLLDSENEASVVSWVYPPSAAEFDDEDREPVTRLWITVEEDDREVVLEFGATVVGAGAEDDTYVLDPDTLADDIVALEQYRLGSPRPEFG